MNFDVRTFSLYRFCFSAVVLDQPMGRKLWVLLLAVPVIYKLLNCDLGNASSG